MIQKITISNFFSIREPLEVSFEASKEKQYGEDWIVKIGNTRLLKSLLLYGANGSGKTNILLALDFLRHLLVAVPTDVDDGFAYMQFAFDPASREEDTTFDMHFFIEDTKYQYKVSVNPDRIKTEELRVFHNGNSSKSIYTRKYNEEKGINVVRFGAWVDLAANDRKAIEASTTGNISVLSVYATKNISCELLTRIRNYFKYNFFKLYEVHNCEQDVAKALRDNESLKLLLIDMLKSFHTNIINFNVEETSTPIPAEAKQILMDLKVNQEEKEQIVKMKVLTKLKGQYVHKTDLGEFPLEDTLQSEGTKTFISYLVLFYKAIRENWLLALDEYGAGMQAKSQNLLLDFFLKFSKRSQLILATQSLGLLDYSRMRRDAIQIVYKDELGQSHIDSKTVRSIHKNIKLRKAYIDGRFTTIDPNEPDINLDNEYTKYQSLIFGQTGEEVTMK